MRLKTSSVRIPDASFLEYQNIFFQIACKRLFSTNTDLKQEFKNISLIDIIIDI